MSDSKKVALATQEVTIHQTNGSAPVKDTLGNETWVVSSVTLLPGQCVDLDSLPPYLKEKAQAGKVDGVVVTTAGEAKKALAEAQQAFYAAQASGQGISVERRETSHSDWLVPDEERAANLAAQADAEAGEGSASADVLAEAQPAEVVVGDVVQPSADDTGDNVAADKAKAGAKKD